MSKDNKLYTLVDNVIGYTNSYFKLFADKNGKISYSESSISDLSKIIKEIFKLNNYIVETEQYTDNMEVQDCLENINKYGNKLAITESNAKNLDVKKAVNYWENIHNYGFKLAFLIAEEKEYYKEEN